MRIITKHILTALLYSLIISFLFLGAIFYYFPIDDWKLLFTTDRYDLKFIFVYLALPVIGAIVIGSFTGLYWQRRVRIVERQLDELIRKQKQTDPAVLYSELQNIYQKMNEVADIFSVQSEQAQKLATKRSEEREQSLQEVVIQERNRLARELHDSVSQQLFAASMMMSALTENRNTEVDVKTTQLEMVEKMIHQSQLEMRALLLHLRPVPLKGKSLQEGAIELLAELKGKVPLEIDWTIETFTIDKGVEDQLFRILQESVSNTLRHADAKQLNVLIIQRAGFIILRITDDGIGFDVNVKKTGSYGLDNMEERAFEAGGTFRMVSYPEEGTHLEVKVPFIKKEVIQDDTDSTS